MVEEYAWRILSSEQVGQFDHRHKLLPTADCQLSSAIGHRISNEKTGVRQYHSGHRQPTCATLKVPKRTNKYLGGLLWQTKIRRSSVRIPHALVRLNRTENTAVHRVKVRERRSRSIATAGIRSAVEISDPQRNHGQKKEGI